jgi:hypothetical protein
LAFSPYKLFAPLAPSQACVLWIIGVITVVFLGFYGYYVEPLDVAQDCELRTLSLEVQASVEL